MKYTKIFLCFVAIALATSGCSSNGSQKTSDNQETKKFQDASIYKNACKELDFETAREYMSELHQIYIDALSKPMFLEDENKEAKKKAENKYYEAFDYIYKAEIQYLLSEFDEDECVDKLAFFMEDIPIEGEKVPAGLCDFRMACRGDFGEEGVPLDAYIVWTEHYNRLCNTILSLSINRNYPKLAKFALMQFVDNVEAHKGGDGVKIDGVKVDGNHGYIKYTSTDRDAAKKKYNEAVKMGLAK